MILHVNYEELTALQSGARVLLDREEAGEGSVLAPCEEKARVEALLPQLSGDLSLSTLHDLREVQRAIQAIVSCLRVEMEVAVVTTHAAETGGHQSRQ